MKKVKNNYYKIKKKYEVCRRNSATSILLEIYDKEIEISSEQEFLIKELELSTLKLYLSMQELDIPWK